MCTVRSLVAYHRIRRQHSTPSDFSLGHTMGPSVGFFLNVLGCVGHSIIVRRRINCRQTPSKSSGWLYPAFELWWLFYICDEEY